MNADKRLDVTIGGLHVEDDGQKIFEAGPMTWYDLPYEVTLLIQRNQIELFAQLNALGYAQLAEAQKAQQSTTPTV
jgi:hypothetical protein